jgi:phosphotransferase family enzyme
VGGRNLSTRARSLMGTVLAFSELVAEAAWRADVDEWIGDVLRSAGLTLTGGPERRRTRPWSTQCVVSTNGGRVWFKANCPELSFEPALHRALGQVAPGMVEEPIAVDATRGWMLTRDRGVPLAERHEPSLDDWCAIAQEAADLQRVAAEVPEMMLRTGIPDCAPATVVQRFDNLVERFAALDPTHPSHLASDLLPKFEAARSSVVDAAADLAQSPLPVTVNHGDLHPGNVFVVDGGLRLFDFGDAQWAAAPEVLGALWGWLTRRTDHPWRTVFAAYAEVWSDLVTADEFEGLVAAAMVTLPVNRSQTWWAATSHATDEELAEWGGAPLSQLSHVLSPWP